MVIVQLIGGLGNQLFQYAIGRKLAYINQVDFKIDISAYENYELHNFALSNFNIVENIATKEEVIWMKNENFIIEPHFHFWNNIFYINCNAYLQGYWQSEKYFIDIRDILLNEFKVKTDLLFQNKEVADIIQNTNSVSLHIRRGDYISNRLTNSIHGTCSLSYYQRAIEVILDSVENPNFFIFSDDFNWVKNSFHVLKDFKNVTFIDFNGPQKNYEDLRLMSLCKHNIIANSTFSWWGAWLNDYNKKTIISPKKWFNTTDRNTRDLFPTSWIEL